MSLTLVTRPTREPISIQDLKAHLRISDEIEDGYLQRLARSVRSRCERVTRRALLTQTWDLYLDAFPDEDEILLPKAPLQSVTYVKYTDTAGTVQTWSSSNYTVDAPSGDYAARGRVALDFSAVWPVPLLQANSVQVRFVCGYGDAPRDVPDLLVTGMLLDAGTLFEIREAVGPTVSDIPRTAADIYRSFRSL